jgi:hypothetical protein
LLLTVTASRRRWDHGGRGSVMTAEEWIDGRSQGPISEALVTVLAG